jgi:hypothetical protein
MEMIVTNRDELQNAENTMAIQYKQTSSFKPAPAGAAVARCVQIIDLGTQTEEGFKGRGVRHVHKIRFGFELPFVKMTEGDYAGQPYVIHRRFTLSFHPKSNLKAFLETWFAKKIEGEETINKIINNFPNFLGQVCQVTIVHSEDGEFANIMSIGQFLGEKKAVPAPFNPLIYFELSPEGYKKEIFEKLPEKTQETIKQSPEWIALNGGPTMTPGSHDPRDESPSDDDVPF